LDDIEHVVINIHVIEPQASVEIFKSMGWELAMDISRHL
jgi:predicted lactoylglutathione lyase